MRKLLMKIQFLIVQTMFNYWFGSFKFPFEEAEIELNKKNGLQQFKYCEAAKLWYESDTFKTEYKSLVRKFYRDLATQPVSEPAMSGYRLSLTFAKYFELRLKELSARYDALSKQPKL